VTVGSTRVVAAGAGRMGRGIALAFAYGGYEVDLVDLKVRSAAECTRLSTEAKEEMASSLAMLAELGAIPQDAVPRLLGRIHLFPEPDSKARLANADVIFEGVSETLEAKKDAFA
jgi:3-hydroxybutyryl-CoA dehydrogenase